MAIKPPYSSQDINLANHYSGSPSSVRCRNTKMVAYYEKQLLEKIYGTFEFSGPDFWPRSYLYRSLFCAGYVGILDSEQYGKIPQYGSFTGFDLWYYPTEFIVANPKIDHPKPWVLGEDAEIIRLRPDYSGVMDIVSLYADLMALIIEGVGLNVINSKLSYVFAAGNKQMAESFKKLYDDVASGEPAVFVNRKLVDDKTGKITMDFFTSNLAANYITPDMLRDLTTLDHMFCTTVGIPSANQEKRERLVTDEVNANNVETRTQSDLWLQQINADCDRINARWDLGLHFRYRYDMIEEGGVEDGEDNLARNVQP